jgi:NADPH-dependent 2,4-dienoyl-CoA reductase/sulfur reductase-like enzyme
VIATGATPRHLPGVETLTGVFTLRTLDDARRLRAALDATPAPRVVVVGAGFIGAEVAATCRARGLDVTVLEALSAPMVRGLGAELGMVLGEMHREHGVDLRLAVQIAAVEGDGHVSRVRLADGEVIPADVLVVGIGVVPEVEWLRSAGLEIDNGIVCDETCLAAPHVYAAGDVARFPNALFDDALMRLEHWTNATEQGMYVAERILASAGADDGEADVAPFAPVPFVWSDQYDVKIQSVGFFNAEDDMEVVHGTLESRRFVALFGRGDRLVGALGFSQPRQIMLYRRAIAARASFSEAVAAARAD